MSPIDYRAVIHHHVVMKTLHDIEVTTNIRCIEFSIQCIPKLLTVLYVHLHITQMAITNTKNASPEGTR